MLNQNHHPLLLSLLISNQNLISLSYHRFLTYMLDAWSNRCLCWVIVASRVITVYEPGNSAGNSAGRLVAGNSERFQPVPNSVGGRYSMLELMSLRRSPSRACRRAEFRILHHVRA